MWNDYCVFEERSVDARDPSEKRLIANKQRSVVEDKHKLAEDV